MCPHLFCNRILARKTSSAHLVSDFLLTHRVIITFLELPRQAATFSLSSDLRNWLAESCHRTTLSFARDRMPLLSTWSLNGGSFLLKLDEFQDGHRLSSVCQSHQSGAQTESPFTTGYLFAEQVHHGDNNARLDNLLLQVFRLHWV